MKVMHIIYSLSSGGAERLVVDLSNELANQGCEVVLCVVRDDSIKKNAFYKNELSHKVTYKNLAIKDGINFQYTLKINGLINEFKPDVVHCHLNLVNYLFPIALAKREIKFFYTVHNDAFKEIRFKFELMLRKYFFRKKYFNVVTISPETSESYIKCYKLNNFTEIYNGRKQTNAGKEFGQVKKQIDELRGIDKLIFLHVGRFVPQKNQRLLINVFNRLVEEGIEVVLLIIGSGFETSKGKELQSLSNANIHYLGEKHNVIDFFLNSDAFCLSSNHEGMPITLIEALSCGCTPICTPVGGIKDVIIHGVNGFLSQSISEEAYYVAVTDYIKNREKIKSEDVKKLYFSMFSIEKCAKLHFELYSK